MASPEDIGQFVFSSLGVGQAPDITPRPPVIDLSVHADVDIKSNQLLT